MNRPLAGTRIILDRGRTWLTSGPAMTTLSRGIGTLAATAAAGGVLTAKPILWWPLTAGWLIAAALQPAGGCTCEQDTAGTFDPQWFTDAVRTWMNARGRDRALFIELAGHFGVDNKTLKEWCAAAGIEVKRSIRVKGVGNNTGIYLASLPDPSPTAPADGVDAGQSVNVNINGTPISMIYTDPDRGPNAYKVIHT